MANEEHVRRLKSGVEKWNVWLADNRDVRADLHGADLSCADLSGANLREANLREAKLSCANLNGAKLSWADLSGADLSAAHLSWAHLSRRNLRGANLRMAELREADLSGADLREADLRRADLFAADLSGANLRGADLSEADLNGADLNGAKLGGAHLNGADLRGADLRRADLSGAYLNGAHLRGAHLGEADLSEADLSLADLRDANLRGTKLIGARAGLTTFVDVDLSVCRGLETINHLGPSSVGIDTVYRSRGNIPESFLRGAGVPDGLIVQMKALVGAMEPIQFYSCFISYSSNDGELAQRIHNDLRAASVRCWFAPEDLKIGDKFRQRIDEAIRVYDKLLLLLSDNSVSSKWVEREVESAFEQEDRNDKTVLFPVRLDDSVMETDKAWAADIRRTRHVGDFRDWKHHDSYQKAFDRLLRDLKASEDG